MSPVVERPLVSFPGGGTTIGLFLKEASAALARAGLPSPRLDAEVLLARRLGRERAYLFAHGDEAIGGDTAASLWSWVERRLRGEPVAYIVGRKDFWTFSLSVDPRVLIPRPETELLVEEALKILSRSATVHPRIVDVGTGSGAIALALAKERPDAFVVATDISPPAVELARRNASAAGLGGRVSFVVGDLLSCLGGEFDLVISNPPYIGDEEYRSLPPGVRDFEPPVALCAPGDGTFFHRLLIGECPGILAQGGWLVMEVGDGQGAAVLALIEEADAFGEAYLKRDYAGRERLVAARRKEAWTRS
ncbi:MAG TPA: peptide chain release factor N(5)-glutamine methyltransferase [Syntrophales bacterium]|mgnify:FL=1|nr:peptide chain release factor N(5)-glutamine methyltransferase [Syntrophales bacterium]